MPSSTSSSIVASDREVFARLAAYFDDPEERRRRHHEADVLIVGAGIAGCALAVAFGRQGDRKSVV